MGAEHLRPWKPGQSGNPHGAPKLPEHLRGIKSLSQLEACKIISKYGRMSKEELMVAMENPKVPVVELAVASVFVSAIKYGDCSRLAFLLDRAIGKAPIITETEEEIAARQEIHNLSNQELFRLMKEKLPELEASKE